MKLLNVRLDADDARYAEELRRAGVQISRLVRDAIRSEHAQRLGVRGKRRTPKAIMKQIYAEHPDPPRQPRRRLDLTNRRALRRAVRARLTHRRP